MMKREEPPPANGVPADHAAMRRANRNLVLDHLRQVGTSSRSQISLQTRLAPPTVTMIVGHLLREGLVSEMGTDKTSTGAGRPRVLLKFNERSSYLLAVHVGVLRTTVVVGDALGGTLASATVPTPSTIPRSALRAIAALALETLDRAEADRELLTMAAFSLPGLIDDRGTLLLAPNLGWRNVKVTEILGSLLGVPVIAYNVTNACLIAEAREGAAHGESDVVLVYAGTGVGAAMLTGGQLVTGSRGIAGEFGHSRAVPNGAPCTCGKTGCLETLVSAEAVAATAVKRWHAAGVTVTPIEPSAGITAADVALAANRADTIALEVLREAGSRLGEAAAWLVNTFNPRCMVLAGGLALAGPVFFDPFRASVEREAMPEALSTLKIRTFALGQESEVRGALLLAAEASRRLGTAAPAWPLADRR